MNKYCFDGRDIVLTDGKLYVPFFYEGEPPEYYFSEFCKLDGYYQLDSQTANHLENSADWVIVNDD